MGILTNTLMLLISIAGFLVGFILSIISPEELRPGKKYFVFIRESLFYLMILFSLFLFVYYQKYYLILIPFIYVGLYVFLTKKTQFLKEYFYLKEISNYLYFIITYIIMLNINGQNFKLLFLSLVFLYGLPAGTLLRYGFIRKQERKHEVKIKRV